MTSQDRSYSFADKKYEGEEFKLLKEGYQKSSQNLKDYFTEKGIAVAHYYYWKKKFDLPVSAAHFLPVIPLALTRKKYMLAGSHGSTQRAAIIYS